MPKKTLGSRQLIFGLGLYVSHVQSDVHARRVRTAMFWSVVSVLFFFKIVQVENSIEIWGISIPYKDGVTVLWFLLAMTLWYGVRFFFSAVQIFAIANPFALWCTLWKNGKTKNTDSEKEYWKTLDEHAKHGASVPGDGKVGSSEYHPSLMQVVGLEQTKKIVDYNARYPKFGFLENFCFLMLVPAILCIMAFSMIVWRLASYYFGGE